MKIIKKKNLSEVRDEKKIVSYIEQSITDLEIETLKKDQIIAELQEVITEGEKTITDLEIEISELKNRMV